MPFTRPIKDPYIAFKQITFEDVFGLDNIKKELIPIIEYLENPARNLSPKKGYILTGPCQTGKSYIAQALAGEIKEMHERQGKDPNQFKFFNIHASIVIQNGIDKIMTQVQQHAPCMVLIEEVELLGLQRAGSNPQLLSNLFSSMSGVLEPDRNKAVIIIAATNKPEILDSALLQTGMIHNEINLEYPSFEDRKKFIIHYISRLADINSFDIDMWTNKTEGQSYQAIKSPILHAALESYEQGEDFTQQALQEFFDRKR